MAQIDIDNMIAALETVKAKVASFGNEDEGSREQAHLIMAAHQDWTALLFWAGRVYESEPQRRALSNNHWSTDNQIDDVIDFLRLNLPVQYQAFKREFPEYEELEWTGAWVDAEASKVDVEYMSHVADWLENNTKVFWEDGQPWIEL